jgi:hypothetical protein
MFCEKEVKNLVEESWQRFDFTTPGGITYPNLGFSCGVCWVKAENDLRKLLKRVRNGEAN